MHTRQQMAKHIFYLDAACSLCTGPDLVQAGSDKLSRRFRAQKDYLKAVQAAKVDLIGLRHNFSHNQGVCDMAAEGSKVLATKPLDW